MLLSSFCTLNVSVLNDENIASKIEAAYHRNDMLKKNKLFKYDIFISRNGEIEAWKNNYAIHEGLSCSYYENDQYIVCKEKYKGDYAVKANSGKPNTLFNSIIVLYNKNTFIQYRRMPSMAHILMVKTPTPEFYNTPFNYGVLSPTCEFSLDALFRMARAGVYTVKVVSEGDRYVRCKFSSKTDPLHFDWKCDVANSYLPVALAISSDLDNPSVNTTNVYFERYQTTSDGAKYPEIVHQFLTQNGKISMLTTIRMNSVQTTPPTQEEMGDKVLFNSSMNIADIKFSSINVKPQIMTFDSIDHFFSVCETTSTETLKKIQSSNNYYYVWIPVALIALLIVALYLRERKAPLPKP
jgi:hypothetical protein